MIQFDINAASALTLFGYLTAAIGVLFAVVSYFSGRNMDNKLTELKNTVHDLNQIVDTLGSETLRQVLQQQQRAFERGMGEFDKYRSPANSAMSRDDSLDRESPKEGKKSAGPQTGETDWEASYKSDGTAPSA